MSDRVIWPRKKFNDIYSRFDTIHECEGHTYRQTDTRRRLVLRSWITSRGKTRICAAEMAVRYAALSACRKVHVCHCNSLGGAT